MFIFMSCYLLALNLSMDEDAAYQLVSTLPIERSNMNKFVIYLPKCGEFISHKYDIMGHVIHHFKLYHALEKISVFW